MREGDDHAQARAHEPEQLVLGLADAAARERRALRLEAARRPASGSSARDALEQLDDRRLAHVGALARRAASGSRRPRPRRSRAAVEHAIGLPGADARRARSARARSGTRPFGTGTSSSCVHSSTSAGARRASRAGCRSLRCELGERALREHREARDALDLVAEELDAHGLCAGRREDVEDVAAHGQLAAVADALDALVARARRAPRRPRRARALPRARRAARAARRVGRRHALDERRGRDRDEPAGRAAGRARARARRRGAAPARDPSRRRRRARAGSRPRLAGAYQAASSATSRARLVVVARAPRGRCAPRRGGAARAPRGAARAAASGQRAAAGSAESSAPASCATPACAATASVTDARSARLESRVRSIGFRSGSRGRRLQDSLRLVTDTLLDELCDWLRIPSISSGGGDPADLAARRRLGLRAHRGGRRHRRGRPGLRQPALRRRAALAPRRRADRADLRPLRRAVARPARALDVATRSSPWCATAGCTRAARATTRATSCRCCTSPAGSRAPASCPCTCASCSRARRRSAARTCCDWVAEDERGADCAIVFDGGMVDEEHPALHDRRARASCAHAARAHGRAATSTRACTAARR